MTTRRNLLAVAGMGTLRALPVPGLAQPLRRVGVLVPAPRAGYEPRHEVLPELRPRANQVLE